MNFFEAESPDDWDYAMKMQEQVIDIDKKVFVMAANPNQIKSATDNNGNFSKDDNNIYHSRITEIKRTPNMFDFIDSLPTSVRAKTAQMLYSADLKMSCR